jgi:hypothetical protein
MSSRALCRVLPWTVLLAGCTVGPDYARPESGLPAAFAEGAGAPDRGGVAADWWQGFGEPELTRLVGRALAANTDVRAPGGRRLTPSWRTWPARGCPPSTRPARPIASR